MKTIKLVTVSAIALALFACASQQVAQPEYSTDSLTLDAAIAEAASYFAQRLPRGAKVALVPFDALTGRLADYVLEELWTYFEDADSFVMIDRRNLDRIEAELMYQYQSGRVDDNLIASMSRQFGAEILVYGQMTAIGQGASEYRMTIYATDVEKASSSQRAYTVRLDNRLTTLLNVSPDEEVERAVAAMARAVSQKTVIAVGRISYADTQTVTSLSAWLKTGIIAGAQKQQDKFQVASESESADFAIATRGLTVETAVIDSAIQAVVSGTYVPLDGGAEVALQLISTAGNKAVLSSQRFVIPASELERRRLSLFPELTQAEFEIRQQAVDPYSGRNNSWNFTVTPDVLDGIYRDGDYMSMRIYSAQDSYFRIIHVDVNGDSQVIYPLSERDNNFIRAGETRRIPDNTRYRLGAPFGEEIILVAAYDRPFASGQVSGTLSADSIIRGLTVEGMAPAATAKFSYTILPR